MSSHSPYYARYFKRSSEQAKSCWNCARLKESKKVEEITYDENGKMKSYNASCDSMMDAISAYHCDYYWFGTKPDDHTMLCGGMDWRRK